MDKLKIVVIDGYTLNPGDNPWDEVAVLGDLVVYDRSNPEQILQRAVGAQVVVVNKAQMKAEILAQLPQLRFIAVSATGYDCVDVKAAGRRGIPVSNVPVYGTDSVAQHVMALLLELTNRVGLHDEAVKSGEWMAAPDWSFWKTPLTELRGKTLGIVGFGRIGRRVGELAHAFGMNVLAYDPFESQKPDYEPFSWARLDELFRNSNVITLHTPLTPDLEGIVNRELLGLVKPGTLFINASRGGLVCEEDLAEALNSGRLGGASLDVVSLEPIRQDNPLLKAQNIFITPHIAWATLEARHRLLKRTAENVRAFVDGAPINVVNTDHLKSK